MADELKPSERIKAAARKFFIVVFNGTTDDNLRYLHAQNAELLVYIDELEERVRRLEENAHYHGDMTRVYKAKGEGSNTG